MYFPNAFRKSFLPANIASLASQGTTADLSAGQIGFFDAKTYAALGTNAGSAPFIIGQGSYFAADKIGPVHGGYKESVKSKVINPKYISRLIKVNAQGAQTQKISISITAVEADKTYRLRVDLKGSPALRFLNHQLYRTLDAYTGCGEAGAIVDPTIVAAKWAKQLVEYPLLKNFVAVTVYDTNENVVTNYDSFVPATGITNQTAYLEIETAYLETKFGSCTFTPTDKYELEPLIIYTSFVDESGDPCAVHGITSQEIRAAQQASGVGETVLRDLILDGRYLQNAYPDSGRVDSLRMREIEADPALATVNRNGLYDQVLVLHNVPRFHNPSSTFDNDQYLVVVHVPAGANTEDFTDFIISAASQVSNPVQLETV